MGSVAEAIGRTPADRVKAGPPVVCWFEECRKESVPLVGGKCASLGELINAGVRVPPGFALTTEGYRRFMAAAGTDREVRSLLAGLDAQDPGALEKASAGIRALIEAQPFSIEIEDLVAECYRKLAVRCGVPGLPVAVRSSATAEDLLGASFAGQQDTFLWIRGVDDVLVHMRRCISSLYTGRAIAYRANRGFGDAEVAMS
ncbi:MAG: PEP/pyruvate-binding domain-containing protein, partial [Phycisphaeraceae bacterium]